MDSLPLKDQKDLREFLALYYSVMVNIQGLTIQQLLDLYDASPPEIKQWLHENVQLWE